MSQDSSESSVVSEQLAVARTELRRERRRTADELEALKRFKHRLQKIKTASIPRRLNPSQAVFTDAKTATGDLARVREAYESTIMCVPHHSEEYDDTYRQSLEEEFSHDIAVALTDGTVFNERCKRATLSAIAASISARELLIEDIDAEWESICDTAETLVPLAEVIDELHSISFRDRSFGALDAYRSRLKVLEKKCEAVSNQRQMTIFETRRTQCISMDVGDIAQYFYQDLTVSYPVISLIVDLIAVITELRHQVERAMTVCRS